MQKTAITNSGSEPLRTGKSEIIGMAFSSYSNDSYCWGEGAREQFSDPWPGKGTFLDTLDKS